MKNLLLLLLLIIASLSASAQNGITWSAPMNVATSAFNNNHPRITLDGQGNPLVIWGNSNSSKAMFSLWNGIAFTDPVTLNPSTMTVMASDWAGPDIASKGDTVYAVFKRTPESVAANRTYIVRSFNGGTSFSTPVQVDFIADSISRFPTVTIDNSGNPIVAFMKFNSTFGDSRWAVTKSTDYGTTFSTDVLASGYSGGNGDVCDCCPGAIVSSSNKVAMLYRDNLNNIRDTWAGISMDNGNSFPSGIGIDRSNWNINACPSSGPDGVIVDDTLYSVSMSGASGISLVYTNKNSLSALASSTGNLITGSFTGLTQQNYPRIANYNSAIAQVWKQIVSGNAQLGLFFTANIHNGFPAGYDMVATGSSGAVINADVSVFNGSIHVVWQDDNSGTVRYRKGTFTPANTGLSNPAMSCSNLLIYPNPGSGIFNIETNFENGNKISLSVRNTLGEELYKTSYKNTVSGKHELDINNLPNGVYIVQLISDSETDIQKIIIAK